MDIKRIDSPLRFFLAAIPDNIRVEELIVFGSYLEGNATEESDLDVFVISEDFRGMDEDQRLDVLYEAAGLIEPDIQPWGFTRDELKQFPSLSTGAYVREQGLRFVKNGHVIDL